MASVVRVESQFEVRGRMTITEPSAVAPDAKVNFAK